MPEARVRLGIAAALCSLAMPLACAEEPPANPGPMRIEGMAPYGSITRIMEPDYPKALVAGRGRHYVDISGRVTQTGRLVDVIYTPGSNEAHALVGPLREVMEHWQFSTPTDDDCQPSGVVVKNRVSFDFEGERPKLGILRVRDKEVERDYETMKAVKRIDPAYPFVMQRAGYQANVFAKLTVSPEGDVTGVKAVAYPKQDGVDLSRFEKSAVEALSEWKFPPAPEPGRNREGCYTIYYRIKG